MFDNLVLFATVASVRKAASTAAAETTVHSRLRGRYEVIIPDRNGVIFFTDSLAEAASHVAIARWGNADQAHEVLVFLEAVEQTGYIAAGQYGVRLHRSYDDGRPWIAKVRRSQVRPLPKYAIDERVEATDEHADLPSHLKLNRELRIYDVMALNDSRPGRQYSYTFGSGMGMRVSEDRLRPLNAVTGELNIEINALSIV